jgi:hypothetical protein
MSQGKDRKKKCFNIVHRIPFPNIRGFVRDINGFF